MKRKASVLLLLAALGAWSSPASAGNYMSGAFNKPPEGASMGPRYAPEASNYIGPYGQPVPITAPAEYQAPTGADYARAMMMQQGLPPDVIQRAFGTPGGGMNPYQLTSGCGPANCGPGGMGGPGPGLAAGAMPPSPAMVIGPPGATAGIGSLSGGAGHGPGSSYGTYRTEVRFVGPAGMKISWYAPRADGAAGFTPQYLEAPARYNFIQAAIYRLKLSDIPNRAGVELYPTLEVVPANAKTCTFLAHAAVPVNFTEEDFEQIAAGNFIVKVIYLPDPQFQDLAATGPDEVVSSRLEPGVDPIIEAKRRGSILAIVRLGNIDLEAPNTPAMDAPPQMPGGGHGMPHGPGAMGLPPGAMGMMPPGMMPPGMMPPGMMPPGMMPPGMMPPGMMPPGMMPPGMGMPAPGKTPPAANTVPVSPSPANNAAPVVPTPLRPGTAPAPAPFKVSQAPAPATTTTVQPATGMTASDTPPSTPASTTSRFTPRSSLIDLLGSPTK
jgi:hypothetical protein